MTLNTPGLVLLSGEKGNEVDFEKSIMTRGYLGE
jgi:hypothetical protein